MNASHEASGQPVSPEAPNVSATADAPVALAEAPEKQEPEKKEPPFTVDKLLNCTTRMTNKTWYLFYNNRTNMPFIRETLLRAALEHRSTEGALTVQQELVALGVTTISCDGKFLHFTATFETIQTVLKHPAVLMLEAVAL
jgi:hypothetical protein